MGWVFLGSRQQHFYYSCGEYCCSLYCVYGSLSPPYVIPRNTLDCAGGELKHNANIAIDIRDSRAGIVTMCFEDIHFGYSFEITDDGCQMVNPGHHHQIVDCYVRALETYSDLHLFFVAYENNPSNFVFAGGYYPYAGRFFVTDSIWPVFLDYLNPLRSCHLWSTSGCIVVEAKRCT